MTWPQGRPLGFFVPDLLSFVGDKLGGLPGIYLVGFGCIVLNSYLCYRLLRFRMPPSVSLAGAAAFGLFPADTTKILLTHDFQLQPSLTFLLLASLAYASGRRPLAYVLSLGSLLSYENAFMPFFGIPLFLLDWNRRLLRTMLLHVLTVLAVMGGVVVVRLLLGEERAAASVAGVGDIVLKLLGSLVIGPVRALALFVYGPLRAVPSWDLETIVFVVAIGLGAGLVLYRWARHERARSDWSELVHLTIAGGVLLCLGYALAFTHYPPNAVTGRGTSVHLGATLGAAVLFACGVWALQRLAARAGRPALAAVVVGAYIGLASGYAMTIQRDFAATWSTQRAFWHDVLACCSDLEDGTVLIYEWDGSGNGDFIFANSWADALVLERTFNFPSEWSTPPRLFSLTSWHERVEADGDGLRWRVPEATWYEYWAPLPQENIIVLRRDGENLIRETGTLDVAGRTLELKPRGPSTVDGFGRGPLWQYLAAPPG